MRNSAAAFDSAPRDMARGAHAGIEARLNAWLRDSIGLDETRRVVRADPDSVLVSKFEPGFAPRLHDLLDELPELFDMSEVEAAYGRCAREAGANALRVAVWGDALRSLLSDLCAERGIEDGRAVLVRVGLDSVQAVLSSVIWSDPAVGDVYQPLPGEIAAYRDATARLDPAHDLFTRYYGTFEQRRVENHCPGASFARVLLAQAWTACTGSAPPGPAA